MSIQTTTIVRDTSGALFAVRDTDNAALQHVWLGTAVKRAGAGYETKAHATERLVRKAGCVVVQEGR